MTLPNSYLAGGFALPYSVQQLGFGGSLLWAEAAEVPGYELVYNYMTNLLQAFVRTTGVEVANAVDLSALTTRVWLQGTSAF